MNALKSRLKVIYKALFNQGIPLHNNEGYEPFFIVGSGRCGTTLLRRILTSDDNIYIPPENWAFARSFSVYSRFKWHEDWISLIDLITSAHCRNTQGWFKEFPKEFSEKAYNCSKNERSLSWLLDKLYRYQAELSKNTCKRWGDKTPLNVRNLHLIKEIFPDAKFVHMLRDGVDVVYSWKRQGYYGDDILQPAKRWKEAVNLTNRFRKKNAEAILEVKYEDLVTNPEKKVKEICDFLNIKYAKDMFCVEESSIKGDLENYHHYENALKSISDEHIGKGRKELNKKEKSILANELNHHLRELNYPVL